MRRGGALQNWLGYGEAAAGIDLDSCGDVVPTAQLGKGDTEAVGDGDESISAAHGVQAGARGGHNLEGDGNDEGFNAGEGLIGG